MQKLFSIVIPTYKGENSLPIALESINRQTYKNIEVIVSDDNGKDTDSQISTEKIVEHYKTKLDIKYFVNNHVNGSHARNIGLKAATGDYISLLDDDDFYLNTYVEDAISNFDGVDIVLFDVVAFGKEGMIKKVSCPNIDSKTLLFGNNEIGTGSNICFKKRILDDGNYFDERYLRYQDIEYMCKILNKYEYRWVNKVDIVKYYNSIDNYPNIQKALSMQELIRKDMVNVKIIKEDEIKELENKQLHSLYNDYLAKQVDKKNLKTVYYKLKEHKINTIIDNCMYLVYMLSKRLFSICLTIYTKKEINTSCETLDKYIDYRSILMEEAKLS